jgi:hypothetical protein
MVPFAVSYLMNSRITIILVIGLPKGRLSFILMFGAGRAVLTTRTNRVSEGPSALNYIGKEKEREGFCSNNMSTTPQQETADKMFS